MKKILIALTIATIATPAASANGKLKDFVGTYECRNGPNFILTEKTYTLSGDTTEKIVKSLAVKNGIQFTLSDGYRFGVWKFGNEYEWASGESGDGFVCNKIK